MALKTKTGNKKKSKAKQAIASNTMNFKCIQVSKNPKEL